MTDLSDLAWFTEWIDTQKWTFAKSMKDSPHSYVVREKPVPKEIFERAVRVIRTFGEPGKFYSKTHIYLTVGDEKFWTMGYPVWQTKIINRAAKDKHYGPQDAPRTYSGVTNKWHEHGADYDDAYPHEEEWAAIKQAVVSLVGAYAPRTIDIGCGTGKVIDYGLVPTSLYTGVDPAQGMLNEFVRKVNLSKKKMPDLRAMRAEDFDFAPAYDLGLALNGAASYVSEEVLDRMAACCANLVLMPLTDGPNAELCRTLGGTVVRVGKFDLVTVKG